MTSIPGAKLTLKVWGKDCEVTVYQKSKTAWVATGEYMGERIDVTGSSQRTALAQWQEAAKYKGNL